MSNSDSLSLINNPILKKTKSSYHKFELVWAKVPGFSWWPGKIIAVPEKNSNVYSIIFSGDGSVAYLKPQNLRPYIYGEEPPVNLRTASIDLKRSIQHFKREFQYGIMMMVNRTDKVKQRKNDGKSIKQNGQKILASKEGSNMKQNKKQKLKSFQITYHKQHDESEEQMAVRNPSRQTKELLEQKESEKQKAKPICDWKIDFIQSMVQKGLKRSSAAMFLKDLMKDNPNQSEKVQFTASRNELKQVKINSQSDD